MSIKICNTQGKRWNEAARSYFDLKEGEVWCPECKGAGQHPPMTKGEWEMAEECYTCQGAGKLDWVERIVGKPNRFDFRSFFVEEAAENLRKVIDQDIIEDVLSSLNNK